MVDSYRSHRLVLKEKYEAIKKSVVTVIGMGATGSAVAELLTRAGIKKLKIIDRDIVEKSNLIRQTLYTVNHIGLSKIEAAIVALSEINPQVTVEGFALELNAISAHILLREGIIFDCTDNIETRQIINAYCHKHQKAWIHTAVAGTLSVCGRIDPNISCFSCYIQHAKPTKTCETDGVLNTAVYGCASQAVSLFYSMQSSKYSKNILYRTNWSTLTTKTVEILRYKKCEVCKKNYSALEDLPQSTVKLCGTNMYQIRLNSVNVSDYLKRFSKKRLIQNKYKTVIDKKIIVFSDNRVFIPATSEKQAKSIAATYFPF